MGSPPLGFYPIFMWIRHISYGCFHIHVDSPHLLWIPSVDYLPHLLSLDSLYAFPPMLNLNNVLSYFYLSFHFLIAIAYPFPFPITSPFHFYLYLDSITRRHPLSVSHTIHNAFKFYFNNFYNHCSSITLAFISL